jgi:hypothetical protein
MEEASVQDFVMDSFARSCKSGIRQGAGAAGRLTTSTGILPAGQGARREAA